MKFTSRLDYHPFRLKDDATRGAPRLAARGCCRTAADPAQSATADSTPTGSSRHGIPTVTFGAGQNNIHTIEEYVDLPAYLAGCRMALALATLET